MGLILKGHRLYSMSLMDLISVLGAERGWTPLLNRDAEITSSGPAGLLQAKGLSALELERFNPC
jgi:hypothetical protein